MIYDFAYQRQRLDLLDWGRQVAEWDIDHPDLSQALATGAAGAWAAGDLETAATLALRGISSDRRHDTSAPRPVGVAGGQPGDVRRETSTRRSDGSRSAWR